MRRVRVENETRGSLVGERVGVADRWWTRLKGLIGSAPPGAGEGLLLTPCRAVHMLGMRLRLDVAFVNDAGRVVALYAGLGPGERTRWHREARHAVELPAGTLEQSRTQVGDRLRWAPVGGALSGTR